MGCCWACQGRPSKTNSGTTVRGRSGATIVGHIGDDLERHPQARIAGQLEPQSAQVEDLLHAAREQDGEQRVVEGHLGVGGQGRRLRERIIAAQGQDPAVPADAREIGVLEDVAGAIDAGTFAVPHAQDAVVFGPGKQVGQLAAIHRGGPQILVDAGDENHVVLAQQGGIALERLIETTQWRAPVAGNQGGGVQAPTAVSPMLIERQPHQRLDARQKNLAAFELVPVIERHAASQHDLDRLRLGSTWTMT
jgi:hypothetical protein